MALNGVINGTDYLLVINGKYAILGNNTTLSVEQSTKDITVRETDNWSKSLLKDREWNMDFEGKMAYKYSDGTLNTKQFGLFAISADSIIEDGFMNQEKFYLYLYSLTSGTPFWTGMGYLTSVSIDAPNEASSGINFSFAGAGPLIQY
tara:strand:+ start:355 stop:798 length:444 start_codon:yes stop_codon:yes gene_type:complete